MARMDLDTQCRGLTGTGVQALQLGRLMRAGSLSVRTGVQLDDRSASVRGCIDLPRIGVDEQSNPDSAGAEPGDRILQAWNLSGGIETAFGRHFGAPFGNEAAVLRPHGGGDCQHFLGHRHFEIHVRLEQPPQHVHVVVLDVPAVLTQMQRNAVGASHFGSQRGVHRIGKTAAARLANSRDMIDVDSERYGSTSHRRASRRAIDFATARVVSTRPSRQ